MSRQTRQVCKKREGERERGLGGWENGREKKTETNIRGAKNLSFCVCSSAAEQSGLQVGDILKSLGKMPTQTVVSGHVARNATSSRVTRDV